MFPIYGFGLTYGFPFILHMISNDVLRYLSYPFFIWAAEIAIGFPLSVCDIRMWSYDYLPDQLHWRGIISFAHYPIWIFFGILIETIMKNH